MTTIFLHVFRLQRDQLREHRHNAEFRQEGITGKIEEQNSQLQVNYGYSF
jgi:hypothetical protein